MRAPTFWKYKNWLSNIFLPAAFIHNLAANLRISLSNPKKMPVKIICIGNLVAGGAGKTPTAIAIAKMLKEENKVFFLSRGYMGNNNQAALQVDKSLHTASEVGDEPLLLAEILPTIIAKDRVAGAELAIKLGAEIIIMDDGFQNPRLHKDFSLLVIDGQYGIGNGRVIPAGPMRETIESAIKRTSAILMIGDDIHNVLKYFPQSIKVFRAITKPVNIKIELKEKNVVAFCAIARPRKFYRTLQSIGCNIKETISYPDHYNFKKDDYKKLLKKAKDKDALLVTTEKDFVRLSEEMQKEVVAIPIEVEFLEKDSLINTLSVL
ncbi:MAG: tetraacyldisaccharide 4'-kinase [Pseudomonadota bacterium]